MPRVRPSENITYLIEIHFNEKKIEEDGEYSYENVYNTVCKTFTERGFGYFHNETGPLLIYDRGEKTDYSLMWRIMLNLYDTNWFRRYVSGYYYYDFNEVDSNGLCEPEDILYEAEQYDRKHGKINEKNP
jgi:hypothetical protein